jgi:DNA-binding FadR family transcriptional regulator
MSSPQDKGEQMGQAIPFDHVQKVVLYDEVARQIKKAILGGQYKPGDRLPSERDLAEAFGVGRPTIREALKTLSVRGLVQLDRSSRGYVVQTPDFELYIRMIREQISWLIQVNEDTIPEFWEVIPNMLGLIARSAAECHLGPKDIKRLDDLISSMEACGHNFGACGPLTYEFGRELAERTGNRVIIVLWRMFKDVICDEFPPIMTKMEPSGPGRLIAFHRKILDGIKTGDNDRINRAVLERREFLKQRAIKKDEREP